MRLLLGDCGRHYRGRRIVCIEDGPFIVLLLYWGRCIICLEHGPIVVVLLFCVCISCLCLWCSIQLKFDFVAAVTIKGLKELLLSGRWSP